MMTKAAPYSSWRRAGFAGLATLWAFLRHVIARFVADGCLTGAGALSYTTMVALVPVTALAVAVLSAVPVFADTRDQLLAALFRTFVPEVSAEVEWWFRYFAGIAMRTTTIGIAALAVTVILLLATIEDQLHHIWRVKSPRPWVQRILAYWAILTLGPLLLGVSFSLPSYLDLIARHTGIETRGIGDEPGIRQLLHLLPFALEAFAFTLVYALIPSGAVRWRNAAVGAVVASVLIELLKIGFVVYIGYLSSYQAVYGALAAIPIFLLWMYVAWSAVLFGAVVAAALPQWQTDEHAARLPHGALRLGLGLALVAELSAQTTRGGTVPTAALADRLGVSTATVDDHLSLLRRAGFVAAAADGGWVLARRLDDVTLMDLYRALDLPLAASLDGEAAYPWQRRITGAIGRIAAAESAALALPLGDLVAAVVPDIPVSPPSRPL
jgi:membrane protein